MKIVPFLELNPQDWDSICDRSDLSWFFHRWNWIQIEEKHFQSSNFSFGIVDSGGSLIAVHPLFIDKIELGSWTERLLHSGVHRYTGLAFLNNVDPIDQKKAVGRAMEHIFNLANSEDIDRIQLNSNNLAPRNLSSQRSEIPFWVEKYNFFHGQSFSPCTFIPVPGMSTCVADYIIDLSKPESVLFEELESNCRNAVKQSLNFDLKFECQTDIRAVEQFYQIAQLSAQRTGESFPPISYYLDLWQCFVEQGQLKLFFVIYEGKPVAALFTIIDKESASYFIGVSDPEYLNFRVNNFIQWAAINWAKSQGLKYYRMGPWFPEVPREWPISKISIFKKKFGGRPYTLLTGSYFRKPQKYLDGGIQYLKNLVQDINPSIL